MKYLWRNKIAFIIILILVLFILPAISLPEQSKTENVVTAIGVDKENLAKKSTNPDR